MENKLTLSLGGEERTLFMNKMGFLKNLNKINTEKINLLDASYLTDPGKSYDVALLIVKAGLLSSDMNFDPVVVEKWFDELPIELISDIHYAGIAAITQKTVEELKNAAAQAIAENGKAI